MTDSRLPVCYLIRPELIPDGYEQAVPGGTFAKLHALAQGLAASPAWDGMSAAALVLRRYPPILAVLGIFTEEERARIEALRDQLDMTLVLYLDWAAVREAVEELAARLQERFGTETLARAHFLAIPRGGIVVLGMLVYLLGLEPDRLGPASDDALTVVVDDCAISGARFRTFLHSVEAGQVIFASLCSAPGLRAAIEAAEQRVVACLSGFDLHDRAPDLLGADYPDWSRRWRDRFSGYWEGHTEHICFPWNEPDVAIWNPAAEQVERGWRVIPPHLCLKNRLGPASPRLSVLPETSGPLRPTTSVIYGTVGDRLLLVDLDGKRVVDLDPVAADTWTAIVETGTMAGAVTRLQSVYDADPETLRSDVEALAAHLIAKEYLEATPSPATDSDQAAPHQLIDEGQ